MKYYLGIDVGGTNIAFGIADESKRLFAKHSIKTNPKRDFEIIIQDMAENIVNFLDTNNISMDSLQSIGIGVPGIVDFSTKKIVMAANLGWYDVDVIGELNKYINKDIYIANDADAATFGELLVSDGLEHMAMLTLGTGVGGGVIYDGKIFGGGDGIGFELGHLILQPNGLTCNCGNKGCMEMYVSTTALIRMAKENISDKSQMFAMCDGDTSKIDGKIIFSCAKNKDEDALKTLEIYGDYLALACYNTIMSYRPQALMIGGGISVQEELLIDPVRAKVAKMLSPMGDIKKTPIIRATLGNDAGILGACFLSLNSDWK